MSYMGSDYARARRAEWIASGLCSVCGKRDAVSGRRLCRDCADKMNEIFKQRYAARAAQGLCPRCGKVEPAPERKMCKTCTRKGGGVINLESLRRRYWARIADGLCAKCGKTAPETDRRYCPTCAEKCRASERAKKKRLRATGLCVECRRPSSGTYLCAPCNAKHQRYAARSMPIWSPSYTVWEIATDTCHGTWDSPEDVALCLAFAKLSRAEVEIVTETPAIAAFVGYS